MIDFTPGQPVIHRMSRQIGVYVAEWAPGCSRVLFAGDRQAITVDTDMLEAYVPSESTVERYHRLADVPTALLNDWTEAVSRMADEAVNEIVAAKVFVLTTGQDETLAVELARRVYGQRRDDLEADMQKLAAEGSWARLQLALTTYTKLTS